MRTPPQILIVDDNPTNVDILQARLTVHGYDILTASDGEQAVSIARERQPDLILLDVMMPKMDGIEVCRHLKGDPSLPFMPIILVTAKSDSKDVVAGLEAGAEEYLTKPVDQQALVARVKSMLKIKDLHDTTQEQAAQLSQWNRTLEERVKEQLAELERMSQLKRFFSPHLAKLIVSSGDKSFLKSHRQEITVLFCDLRGYTKFATSAEPEEEIQLLDEYHKVVGSLVFGFEATLEHYAGDGIMAFFNDPIPCPSPAVRAIRMALAMQREVGELLEGWRKRGFDLGFGVGIAMGYATLGQIGFEGQFHYAAVGSVSNLAARLCDKAQSGQILISQRVYAELEGLAEAEPVGELALKGFEKPLPAYNVLAIKADESPHEETQSPGSSDGRR